jgi:hypothetical protein
VLYDYVWIKQIEILLKIDFKIWAVNL